MRTESANLPARKLSPRLTQLLAVGWVTVIAAVYLFRYDGWVVFLQVAQLAASSLPGLRIGPHFGEFWWARSLDFGCVAVISTLALGAGAIVVERINAEKNLLTALFSVAVGFWVLSACVLVVGCVNVAAVPCVSVLAICWASPAPRRFFRKQSLAVQPLDGWSKLVLAFVVIAALLNLPGAMVPPFEYDELEYHLGALAEYAKAGRIIFLPHNFYSNMPQLAEMLYLLTLAMTSDIAAKLLHWLFGVLTAVSVYTIGARLWNRNVAITAAALFYCVPFVQDLSQTARIDLATTFFGMLAFGGLLVWAEREEQRGWLWLSAIAAGAAVSTKWTAVAVVLLPATVSLACVRKSLTLTTGYWLLATVFVVPWLVKNWLFTGNPVYPLFYNAFPSPHWSAEQAALFARKHYPSFDIAGLKQFFGLPWHYSLAEPGAVPLLLMTGPLVLVVRNANSLVRRAAWVLVVSYLGWYLLTFRPWRFLMPALPVAALVGASALNQLAGDRRVQLALRCVVAIMLVASLARVAASNFVDAEDYKMLPPRMTALNYALGQVSESEFVERMGGGLFEPILWMNRHLPATVKVLYVGEARPYYAHHTVLWSTAFDKHLLDEINPLPTGVAQLRDALSERGITHVYVNFSEWERLRVNYNYLLDIDTAALRKVLQEHANEIHAHKRGVVWELK